MGALEARPFFNSPITPQRNEVRPTGILLSVTRTLWSARIDNSTKRIMRTHPLLTLIADDSDDDRFLFSRAVRLQAGFQVAGITVDGLETVMYLRGTAPYGNRARYPFPDIVLLDYEMPGYNGLEVLASLLKTARRPRVILWSSAIERIDKHLAYELGAAMVCSKPLLTGQIQNTLKAVASKTSDPFVVSPWNAPHDRGIANRLAVALPTL